MSSVCIQLIVVAVALSLSDVACQTVHNINISDDVYSGRQRRQAQPLTQQQISEIVDRHNMLRSHEGAANMNLMVWDTSLASQAASWAAQCQYRHSEYPGLGENLWRHTTNNITTAVDVWYNEKRKYNYETNKCDSGGIDCRHYTQVVWANSGNVGCAVHYCGPPMNAMYIVCNYRPSGNVYWGRPYTKGPACSMCGNGAGWCNNKLCNTNCSRAGEGCSCAAICRNCGKVDLETCRCKCAKGWHGVDCTHRCNNTHKWYGANPGWPKFACNRKNVQWYCPAMCGLCEVDANAKEGQCPPARGPAADSDYASAQTMFIESHQSTMIFVMVIIAFTITSYDAL